jgi:DNA-binding transcriptional ArsR family regulator
VSRAVRRLDSRALHGLAHPLRVQLFDLLVSEGPATASALGRRLGESSGATSYHLRQLERHGFVETDAERGNRRERWWRVTPEDLQTRGADFEDDPADREAHRLLSAEWQRTARARYESWTAHRGEWPAEWRHAAVESASHLRLDVDEVEELRDELVALLTRWAVRAEAREDDPGYRPVEVQVAIFPNGRPPAPSS